MMFENDGGGGGGGSAQFKMVSTCSEKPICAPSSLSGTMGSWREMKMK